MHATPANRSASVQLLRRLLANAALFFGLAAWAGCSSAPVAAQVPREAVARLSPAPTVVTPYQAIELAKDYVSAHPGSDFAIGSGDSMLPLYQDHDVIVLERPGLSDLKVGQTVVFMGDRGVPVAHLIVARKSHNWVTMGLNNPEVDDAPLTEGAYIGVVVKAYHPTGSPILAYWSSSPKNLLATNP